MGTPVANLVFEAFGSYTLIWTADICLSTFAALVSFAIPQYMETARQD